MPVTIYGGIRRSLFDGVDRVGAVGGLGRQLPFEDLEGLGARQRRSDPDERRPLLGSEISLPGEEFAEFRGIESDALG